MMDKFNFDTQLNSLEHNYLTFKKLLTLMVLANLVLLVVLASVFNREKIVLVPQVAPEYKIWVNQAQVSNEYLTALSRNLLDLLLNITPENVSAQHKELLKFVTASHHAAVQAKLIDVSKNLVQNNLSQNFYIDSIRIVQNKNIAYIDGTLNEYIDKTLASSVKHIYKLTFQVQNYSTQLNDFELLPANDPQLRELQNAKTN